ncbi:hypothetical protein EB796_005245 [Bugula neritina]|uniref:Uncharacterized protein n=1 Tax=Bugula neritina TaxID=10212 RepID=A0A7J7KF01_BUGNE|nr:hypothetical protein EB796_005245 [Bugula neritina]
MAVHVAAVNRDFTPSPCKKEFVENLLSDKVDVTRPPCLHSTASYRYSTDLCLKNRSVSFSANSRTKTKPGRNLHSGTTKQTSNLAKPRRVSSAKERLLDKDNVRRLASNWSWKKEETVLSNKQFIVPKGLGSISSTVSFELPNCLDHPALRGSIVLLSDSSTYSDLPTLPPVHSTDEAYPYSHEIPKEHIHRPKKYTHPYYERVKKIKGWTCNHSGREVRVTSLTGQTIHRFTVDKSRGKNDVREEIVELERLMKGLSTDWGKSTVALYQNEINNLQKMVKETLMMTSLPLTPPDTPDPTGLRKFCKEYETALQALEARHRQCIEELRELEEMDRLYDRAKILASMN